MAGDRIESAEEAEARMAAEQAATAGSGAGKAPKGKGLYITIVLLVVVAALVAVLGYLGRDVKKVVESSADQADVAAIEAADSATQANAAATKAEAAVTKAVKAATNAGESADNAKENTQISYDNANAAETYAKQAAASAKGTAIAVAGKGARLGLCAVTAEKAIAEAKKAFATCEAEANKKEGEEQEFFLQNCKQAREAAIATAKADIEVCKVDLKFKAVEGAAKVELAEEALKKANIAGTSLVAKLAIESSSGGTAVAEETTTATPTAPAALDYDALVIEACMTYLQKEGARKGEERRACEVAKANLGL